MGFLSAIKDSVNQSMKDQTFMPENRILNLKSPFILVKLHNISQADRVTQNSNVLEK